MNTISNLGRHGNFVMCRFRAFSAFLTSAGLVLYGAASVLFAADAHNTPDSFATDLGYVVLRQDIKGIPKEKWPDFSPPKELAPVFDEVSSSVWMIGGIQFCTIDAGEFGGCLAIEDKRKRQWRPLLHGNINGLLQISETAFVVTGGAAHLADVTGYVYIVVRDPTMGWITRKLFESETAVPEIVGTTMTRGRKGNIGKRLVIFNFTMPLGQTYLPGFYGVDDTGVVQYLGVRRLVQSADEK